ncbi:MAG: putative ABC transport system ATP-binding protein [Planctomycetota bacterium]
MSTPDYLIQLEGVSFSYGLQAFELRVPELSVASGQRIACVGPSGCGKTTLIHLISGLLQAAEGRVRFDGHDFGSMSDRERREVRIRDIGMVFQEFELLEYLSALDNILLPFHISDSLALAPADRERARELAQSLGIADKLGRSPARLSQGERQRVALCRALVTQPKLLLCDEATGNLDPRATDRSLELLFDAVEERQTTLIFVTHDRSLLDRFERVVDLAQSSTAAADSDLQCKAGPP